MSSLLYIAAALLLASGGNTENNTVLEDTCGVEEGPWSAALEDWAVSATSNHRHGRIMALPPAQGYYVTDRIDGPLLSPPPQPGPPPRNPQHAASGSRPYDEWQATPPPPPGAGKIVNRPPNPYKDKFKPSYQLPSPNQPIPVHAPPPSPVYQGPQSNGMYQGLQSNGIYQGAQSNAVYQGPQTNVVHQRPQSTVDRVDESRPPPPQKQVSETDLYLLGAIEKLVYRVDLMEKRLRKMEENVHYLVAGVDPKPESCVSNFTRAGEGCYHFSSEAVNWKGASYACRKLKANLLEVDGDAEKRHLVAALFAEKRLKGGDFWTGGLNPGLLWIWSHSARPVVSNSSTNGTQTTVVGEGRCLAWVYDPAAVGYVYRGQDCALRHRYICEKEEDKTKLSNEIERVARNLRTGKLMKPKIIWSDEES